ncbi:MAG: FAD:protein FMN transferase, partial [Candidatus Marinimicrobia bacterium]|nr:FAD:protein FMN transferase [Candidatus Neomarinimicrobiota bacterium]
QMSTWDKHSEISNFNQARAGEIITISDEFYEVLLLSKKIGELSDGAFDITVGPAVNWWGFGQAGENQNKSDLPDSIYQLIGYQKINIKEMNSLCKKFDNMSIDLSAIAKGYAVDCSASFLEEQGYTSFLVEIGGEIVVRGEKGEGNPWLIGVDRPVDNAIPGQNLTQILALKNVALATSGDYRNFWKDKGRRYSHIIDPRTACPTDHQLASVTVVAKNCAEADGFATAFSVLGHEKALEIVEKLPEIEAFFIVRTGENEFKEIFSSGFTKLLIEKGS